MKHYNDSLWNGLAFFRFILASIVFWGHLSRFGPNDFIIELIYNLSGKVAVLCFLFISGFSINHSYKTNKNGFYKRRILRIYPMYFFAVVFAEILQFYLAPMQTYEATYIGPGVLTGIANLFLFQGIFSITITFNGPLWSLSLEFILYLFTPILEKIKVQFIFIFILVSFLVFLISFPKATFLWGFVIIQYSWAWLLGYLFYDFSSKKLFQIFAFVIFVTGSFAIYLSSTAEKYSIYTCCLFFILLFTMVNNNLKIEKKTGQFFIYLGNLSYTLYVLHLPLILLFYSFGLRNLWIYISLVYLLIIPFHYIFEVYLKKVFWKPFFYKLFNFAPEKLKYLF